jgi:DNA-damage-inducible protein J
VIEQYGFTPSQVFNLFLTEIANTKSIPLDLSYLKPNAVTLRAMADVEKGDVEIIESSFDMNNVMKEILKKSNQE